MNTVREVKSFVGWRIERLSKRLRKVASRLDPDIPADEVANFVEILHEYRQEQRAA